MKGDNTIALVFAKTPYQIFTIEKLDFNSRLSHMTIETKCPTKLKGYNCNQPSLFRKKTIKFPEGTREGQFTLKAYVEDYYCVLEFPTQTGVIMLK